MVSHSKSPAARRRGPTSRTGLRLVVFHASPDVQTDIAPLRRNGKFRVACYSQRAVTNRPRMGVDAVLWELSPGRRPNWRRLKAIAGAVPIVSYSATQDTEIGERSRAIGFACHLDAPVSTVEIEHQVALASPADLATRLRQSQPMLRRYLGRVEVINEMHRAVSASFEPALVGDALAARAAAWLPVANWAVVGRDSSNLPALIAERGLMADAEMAARAVGTWVLDHSRGYAAANLRDDLAVEDAPEAAAIALPLMCRGRTVAALVGIDRESAPQTPRLSASTLGVLRSVLEPAAYALDNAYRLQRAEELSVTDDLTQLHNSRYLVQALRREGKRSLRSGRPLSLLFVDLDGFKRLNDQHGHLHGSRALVEVATLIRDCSRETDIAARYGGDEFAIVLPDTGSEGAMAVANRLRERIREHAFLEAEGIKFRLTASAGIATMPGVAVTTEGLFQAADDAMYWVKEHGKDGIQLARAMSREGVTA